MTTRIVNVDHVRRHRVRWCETDASGTVHFANYLRFMEETEYAFLRSRGLSVSLSDHRGEIGFPRVATEFEIVESAIFDDVLEISIQVAGNDGVTLVYVFEIHRSSELIACGRFDVACCRFHPGEPPRAILFPDFFRERMPRFDRIHDIFPE